MSTQSQSAQTQGNTTRAITEMQEVSASVFGEIAALAQAIARQTEPDSEARRLANVLARNAEDAADLLESIAGDVISEEHQAEPETDGLTVGRITREWIVPSASPRSMDDLCFTGRDSKGRVVWWHVDPPLTRYSQPQEALGRAHACELLDLIHNPRSRETLPPHLLSFIAQGIMLQFAEGTSESLGRGFFDVISEYLVTGEVNR